MVLLTAALLFAGDTGMNPERLARIPGRGREAAKLSVACHQRHDSRRRTAVDTIFRVMSMSKPITGVGVMILVDDGLLALSDPMRNICPSIGKRTHRVLLGSAI